LGDNGRLPRPIDWLTECPTTVKIRVMQLFGTSGIRRVVDDALVQLALRVGLAVGHRYHRVVIATDTRTSSEAMKHATLAGLLAAGARSYDAGVVPTPTLAYATRRFDAGIMITASHNLPQYNGIKLWNPDGSAFSARQRLEIEALIAGNTALSAPWPNMAQSAVFPEAVADHMERIARDFPRPLKVKVVVDCACGAASVITPYILTRLGCSVVSLDCYPSGYFPRHPEPVVENLGQLMRVTRELGADLGLAHDGDADRVMAVDEKGSYITGDQLLSVLARASGAAEIVTTLDEEMNLKVRRTPIGDPYVSEELARGGDFGGETSGCWIYPAVSFCPDGIYAAAQLAALAQTAPLSELVAAVPGYPMRRGSIDSIGLALAQLEGNLASLGAGSMDRLDGLKLNFPDGWLLVRPSGTEPKIRLTAEARSEARVQEIYESGLAAIKRSVGTAPEGAL
jgi:phosphoglucosamine mutase